MGLNDIHLSASQVADWYAHHLVAGPGNEGAAVRAAQTPPVAPATEAPPAAPAAISDAPTLQYLGKHQKKITLLVSYPKEAYLPENDLTFLTNILQACRLHLGDVAIVNHARHPLASAELRAQLGSQYLLIFGVALNEAELSQQPSFLPLQQEACTTVLVPALTQLNTTHPDAKLLKTRLWVCLKQLFNV